MGQPGTTPEPAPSHREPRGNKPITAPPSPRWLPVSSKMVSERFLMAPGRFPDVPPTAPGRANVKPLDDRRPASRCETSFAWPPTAHPPLLDPVPIYENNYLRSRQHGLHIRKIIGPAPRQRGAVRSAAWLAPKSNFGINSRAISWPCGTAVGDRMGLTSGVQVSKNAAY